MATSNYSNVTFPMSPGTTLMMDDSSSSLEVLFATTVGDFEEGDGGQSGDLESEEELTTTSPFATSKDNSVSNNEIPRQIA